MSHNLKALQLALIKERDDERLRYRTAMEREAAGVAGASHERGLAFGAMGSFEMALGLLHTYTDGAFGQRLDEQRAERVA